MGRPVKPGDDTCGLIEALPPSFLVSGLDPATCEAAPQIQPDLMYSLRLIMDPCLFAPRLTRSGARRRIPRKSSPGQASVR
jgi:hypothetical protein